MKAQPFYSKVLFLLLMAATKPAQSCILHLLKPFEPIFADTSKPLKILSYNIHHGADKNDVNTLDSMGAFICTTGADIVCLQEVDSVCKRSNHINQTAVLAAAAGMQGIFARHFPFEEGAYGNALLSKYPIKNVTVYRLPIDATAEHTSTAMLTADIIINEKLTIGIAVVHLDYRSQQSRVRQSHAILRFLQQHTSPLVLAGDMNAYPGSPELELLTRRFCEKNDIHLPTFPVDRPAHKIDYILFDDGLVPVKYETFDVKYSDHLPIMRTFVLPD